MSAVKRRAGHAASPDLDTPDNAKRLRKRNDADTFFPDVETASTTVTLGRKIISLLKRSQDKNGRLIVGNFLELPDRDEYPDYYETIALPLSLDLIEEKLESKQYPDMTALESDLKRMVQNAKDYNSSRSEIFEDAERIRKALSNFMPKHNPAYQDPKYRAMPTPIPDRVATTTRASSATGSEQPSIKLRINGPGSRRRSQAQTEEPEPEPEEDITDTLLQVLDDLSNQENAINFEEKPNRREIPHYYKVIERPTSINNVRQMVNKGNISDWSEFANELRLIWANAKEYNEPGSEIYTMAEDLETFTEDKLRANGVPPKVVPKLTFKPQPLPKQIKLKMGTPTSVSSLDQWKVDGDALERQKAEMASALDRAKRGESRQTSTPAPTIASALTRSVSIHEPHDVEMTGVNGHVPPSSQLNNVNTVPSLAVPTPAIEGEPPRKPVPPLGAPLVNGYHTLLDQNRPAFAPTIYTESNNPIERKFRDSGKGLSDALISSVTYMTNPHMPNDPKWKLTRYASPTKTQTSYYIYLPHDHNSLRIIPELSPTLKSRKRWKLCVASNWALLPASPDVPGGGVYDFHLQPGENVVTVDVIAELAEGEKKEYAPPQLQVDFERVTFYIILRSRDAAS